MDPPSNLNIEFLSKGGENEVYTGNEDIVVKLTTLSTQAMIYGIDGDLYFIDTQIRLRTQS